MFDLAVLFWLSVGALIGFVITALVFTQEVDDES